MMAKIYHNYNKKSNILQFDSLNNLLILSIISANDTTILTLVKH